MKCIKCIKVAKNYELDEIRRVSDTDADERVKGGYWKFIPKSEWKATLKRAVVKNDTVVSTDSTVELSIEEKRLKRKKQK
jgi:hypothetical protein